MTKNLKNILETATHLREDFMDEIPDEIVSGCDETGSVKYKCQLNWFNALNLNMSVWKNFIDDTNVLSEYHSFIDYLKETKLINPSGPGRLTREEDITKANHLLDSLIDYVKKVNS